MKKAVVAFILAALSQIIFISDVSARKTIDVSGWEVEIQDDGTCAMGKSFEFENNDFIGLGITSYGRVYILSGNALDGTILVDNEYTIKPVMTVSDGHYVYSDSDNRSNGKRFVQYFKKGYEAKMKMKSGQERTFSLKGFTNAYKRYAKCARPPVL